jgi:hypothetical protein
MTVQLADSSIKYPEGIVENLLVNVRCSYVFADFVVLGAHEDIPLNLGPPFLRDVNARIDVGARKIQFRIRRRNMTFKFQAKEEQCYLVQDEEARRWRKPQPQYREEKVAATKPKDKASNGRHQPKKAKAINKAKGGRRRKSRTPYHRKNKEGEVCEESIIRVFHSKTGRAQD